MTYSMMGRMLATVAMLAAAGSAQPQNRLEGATAAAAKPSFGCARTRAGSLEALVCSDPLLTALDAELARLYRLATASGASAAAPFIRRDQPAWLKLRNACTGKESKQAATLCARDRYVDRIEQLRAQSRSARSADDKGISLGPFAYACDGIDDFVDVIFINAIPRLARIHNKTRVWIMEAQPSGSGARYQGAGKDETFWSHGNEALFRAGPERPEAKCQQQTTA